MTDVRDPAATESPAPRAAGRAPVPSRAKPRPPWLRVGVCAAALLVMAVVLSTLTSLLAGESQPPDEIWVCDDGAGSHLLSPRPDGPPLSGWEPLSRPRRWNGYPAQLYVAHRPSRFVAWLAAAGIRSGSPTRFGFVTPWLDERPSHVGDWRRMVRMHSADERDR